VSEVLLGVSGGVAAYRALDVLRGLQRRGHGVTVVMTRAATRFVGAASFAALSGRPVGLSLFEAPERPSYRHLELARAADLMLVAPASANTLARMAAGMADDVLTACHVAFGGPVLVAPAMNSRMYVHPATRDNLARLVARGVEVIPPGTGLLADGEVGIGRLAEPAEIVEAVVARLAAAGRLAGRRVLVSAGGTREPIDAVRFLGNASSGRMGWALADAAHRRGAEVTVLACNVDLPRTAGIEYVDTPTAAALHRAALERFPRCDLLLMAAAVADYRPADARADKPGKEADARTLTLEPTPDILADLAARRDGQIVVGFAAEHGPEGLARAREKRARKHLDVIVHNDVAVEGVIGGTENAITIIGPHGEEAVGPTAKTAAAERVLDTAEALLDARATEPAAAPPR
jgi:phosphopantothenoylcysteine decarboxylase/phosphopantothenate--cysteine ligase